jgi:F-type H+-transporting ATPase subunit alpha
VSLRADEISSLIQKQIEGFEEGIELKETGRVISVGDGIARIHGLENAMAGELLSFPGNLAGMVLNLEEDNVGAILLQDSGPSPPGFREKRVVRRP